MANLVGTKSFSITQLASSGDTCFGLPGQNLTPRLADTDVSGTVSIYDDKTAKIYIKWVFTAEHINYANYHARAWIATKAFTIKVGSNGYPSTPSGVLATYSYESGYTSNFKWSSSATLTTSMYNFTADTSKNSYLWFGGTGYYYVTHPIYPTAVKITVPGLGEVIEEAENFFPYAVYTGGAWKSCNRTGGSFQMYNSSWVDKKNPASLDSLDATALYYDSEWKCLPKVGSE